ncbi:43437_t:CDS:2, partial [Gigaspora margarita]
KQSSEVHELLKRIKDANEYDDDFFLAAQKFINNLYNESKLEQQHHKQILTKDNWSGSTEILINDHLNSNQSSTSNSCSEEFNKLNISLNNSSQNHCSNFNDSTANSVNGITDDMLRQ